MCRELRPHDRCFQALLIASTVWLSWFVMLALHECGHVFNGWLAGAQLDRVDFPLWRFSRTDFAFNPHPLFVAWGGGLWGCLIPLAIWWAAKFLTPRYAYLAAWLAGFCLIANGGYLGGGAILAGGADDAGVIRQNGGPAWLLVAFGMVAITSGLFAWNGLGPRFGLGTSRGKVDRAAAVGMAIVLLIVVCTLALLERR